MWEHTATTPQIQGGTGPFDEKEQAEKKQAAPKEEKKEEGMFGGGFIEQTIADAINVLTASIEGGAEAVRDALAGIAARFIGNFFPGPIGSALGALVGVLIKGTGKAPKVDVNRVDGVVRTFPANLSMMYAQNPTSALFSRRALQMGAMMLAVEYAPGAEHMVSIKAGQGLKWRNRMDGV